jgi:hypothetical protein
MKTTMLPSVRELSKMAEEKTTMTAVAMTTAAKWMKTLSGPRSLKPSPAIP